jgi:hypothetical protein
MLLSFILKQRYLTIIIWELGALILQFITGSWISEGAAGIASMIDTKLSWLPEALFSGVECAPCKKQRRIREGSEGK